MLEMVAESVGQALEEGECHVHHHVGDEDCEENRGRETEGGLG